MAGGRAPVAYGRLAVPLLFSELQRPDTDTDSRLRALASLLDLVHDPERLYQTVNGGFLMQLQVLLKDEDPSVRTKTSELLQVVSTHSLGRQGLLASSLLPSLCELLDDSCASCRRSVLRVLDLLARLPPGTAALLSLVPRLMLKLKEEQEEEEEQEMLLLSIIGCCSRLDALPALNSHGVSVLGSRLTHRSNAVRREAAAAMMALSVPVDGKRQVCEQKLLPLVVALLEDQDVDVQTNAAGIIMNTAIITTGKKQCLSLDVVPVLLHLLSEEEQEEQEKRKERRSKALVLYSLRALTALAEAPAGRHLLLQHLPQLERRTQETEEDPHVQEAARTAIRVITWTP